MVRCGFEASDAWMTKVEAEALTDAVVAWVEHRGDLRALGLADSWSRSTARPESDLDLLILADRPQKYPTDPQWLSEILLPDPVRVV